MKQILVYILFFIAVSSFAQDAKNSSNPQKDFEFIATVNGVAITRGLFDLNLQAALAQGQKDTPQLRETIKNELINRQLIVQEVAKKGLDKEFDLQDQIAQLKQNLSLQVLIETHFKNNPITTEQLRDEYNKQKRYLGNGTDQMAQYKISQIILKSESESIAVIHRLQSGEVFSKVAQQTSLDSATNSNGGALGWVSIQQLAQPVANVVVNLPKGGYSKSPIKVGDIWVVVRVEDVRSSKLPGFEASQNQLKQAIVQQYLGDTIKRLRESAKIVQ